MDKTKNAIAKKAKPTEIISHVPRLIGGLTFSPQEFYSKVEQALAVRQVPDIKINRVDWKEGGPLSERREYLRVTRERLIFDICGAPFGTGFFVSIWFGQKPLKLGWIMSILLLITAALVADFLFAPRYGLYWMLRLGWRWDSETILAFFAAIPLLLFGICAVWVGPNLDQFLIGIPVVGFFYERYFRKITYYRFDRMCMYREAVEAAVEEVIDEISEAHGIQPVSDFNGRSVFRELLQRQGSNGRR